MAYRMAKGAVGRQKEKITINSTISKDVDDMLKCFLPIYYKY
jgi:hypothetical protein